MLPAVFGDCLVQCHISFILTQDEWEGQSQHQRPASGLDGLGRVAAYSVPSAQPCFLTHFPQLLIPGASQINFLHTNLHLRVTLRDSQSPLAERAFCSLTGALTELLSAPAAMGLIAYISCSLSLLMAPRQALSLKKINFNVFLLCLFFFLLQNQSKFYHRGKLESTNKLKEKNNMHNPTHQRQELLVPRLFFSGSFPLPNKYGIIL